MSNPTIFKNGILDANAVKKTSAYTIVASTDSGKTFYVDTAVTFTLPAIAIGNTFTIVYTGEDGAAAVTISPNSADGITFRGSSTDDKDLILTKATAKKGDYVTLASLAGIDAWQVTAARGVWEKQG